MLYDIAQEYDEELPEELTFEETLEIGIEAWNLANNKDFLEENNLFEKALKNYDYSEIMNKMVSYKLEKFSDFRNTIVDYSTDNDILQVKSQTPENHFNSLLNSIIFNKPKNNKK